MASNNHPIRFGQAEFDIILERGAGKGPVYQQIAGALRERIVSGEMSAGVRLPRAPSRRAAGRQSVDDRNRLCRAGLRGPD
jgi:hypothetical protein